MWQEKYKALSRELENTRRKMNDQAEEEIQDLMNQKRIAEKAVRQRINNYHCRTYTVSSFILCCE